MQTKTGIDRLSGVLLLLVVVTSIVAAGLASGVDPVDSYNVGPDKVGILLQRVADNQALHQAEIAFDLASYVLIVAFAGVVYFAFSPHNRPLALLGTLGLAAGGVILAVHDIPWFALPTIAAGFVSASGAEAVALQNTGHALILMAMWGLSVGVTFLGLGALAYSVLMVWSRAVPRALGWLGAFSGLLLSAGVWLPRVDENLYSVFVFMGVPYLLWELGLGIWLLLRGTKEA
jgi:cbb3-type cytochrome oxidase subunit 3